MNLRWVFAEALTHVLADDTEDVATFVAQCGLIVPATSPVYRVMPSLDVCRDCERPAPFDVAPPEFPATPPTVF